MSPVEAVGRGTKEEPWVLKTPPGTSEFEMYRDETVDPPALICQVGTVQLRYRLRAIEDLHAMFEECRVWCVPGRLGVGDRPWSLHPPRCHCSLWI
ncbi:MAG: DUF6855 family protein [Thermoleophilia bacterium]